MAQNEHDGTAGAQLSMYGVELVDLDCLCQLIERHNSDFEAAKQICAKALKMAAHQTSQFLWGFLVAQSDCEVSQSQASVLSQNQPGAKTSGLSERKKHGQRQRGEQSRPGAVK